MHLFGSIQHSWGSWMFTYPFHLTPMGKIMGLDGLWSKSLLLWRRADSGKTKLFLLPIPVSPNSYFCSIEYWNFSSRNLDAHQASPVHGWLSQVFSRGFSLQLRKTRARPQARWHGPQPGQRSVRLLPDAWLGKNPPGSFGVQCWLQSPYKGTSVHG